MKLTKNEKLIIHAVLMDYNIQAFVFPHRNPVAMQNQVEAEKMGKIIVGAQMAMSEVSEFLIDGDEAEELSGGVKQLLGNLLARQNEGLDNVVLEAAKRGEKLSDDFYEQKKVVEDLCNVFPSEKEDTPRIIVP